MEIISHFPHNNYQCDIINHNHDPTQTHKNPKKLTHEK